MPTTRERFICSFEDAEAYLGDRDERPLPGVATRLLRVGEDIAVRYHATNVVRYRPDGWTVLSSGGWETATTKRRINQYAPFGWLVYQDDWSWYIYNYLDQDTPSYEFQSGMAVRGRSSSLHEVVASPREGL